MLQHPPHVTVLRSSKAIASSSSPSTDAMPECRHAAHVITLKSINTIPKDSGRRRDREEKEPRQYRLNKNVEAVLHTLPERAFAGCGYRMKSYFLNNINSLSYDDRRLLGLVISRHNWLTTQEGLRYDIPAHHVALLKHHSLAPHTFSTYSSHWRQLRTHGLPISPRGLETWFAFDRYGEIANTSLQTWIDSVKHLMLVRDGKVWTEEEERSIARIADGICYSNPQNTIKPVGDIGYKEICAMMTLSSVEMTTCDGLALMHATGVRGSQVCGMRHFMFRPVFDPSGEEILFYEYSQDRIKIRPRRITNDNRIESHYTDPAWNELIAELIDRASETYERMTTRSLEVETMGCFMAPGFKATGENPAIKLAAAELGWNEDLEWRVHSCRYGAAADAALKAAEEGKSAQGILDAIRARTAHLSPAMALKYSEVRGTKIVRAQALAIIKKCLRQSNDKGIPFEEFIRFGKRSFASRK